MADNFILQLGADGQTDKNSAASEVGDILTQWRQALRALRHRQRRLKLRLEEEALI